MFRKRAQPAPLELIVDGQRKCNWCGDCIDPIDWCIDCQKSNRPCGVHTRLRKRHDARYCNKECRDAERNDRLKLGRAST
jgi:hypothetical protein